MAKIIWKGFTEHVIRAPRRPLPPDARPLIVPPAALLAESHLAGCARLSARIGFTVSKEQFPSNRHAGQAVDSGGYGIGSATGTSARVFACLGLSAECDSAHRRALQTVPFLYGLRSTHRPWKVFRNVSAADAALHPSVDYLPTLSGRCQSLGFVVLGLRHHGSRRAMPRLHERTLRLAASAARWVPTRRRRWRGLLVPACKQVISSLFILERSIHYPTTVH